MRASSSSIIPFSLHFQRLLSTPTLSLLHSPTLSPPLSPTTAGNISGYLSTSLPTSIPRVSSFRVSALRVSAMATAAGSGEGNSSGVVEFAMSPSSCLKIQKGDITQWSVDGSSDAIVNAANEKMLGGGGVDGAIHRAAGPELKEACYKVPEVRPGIRCPTGEARITPGFRLPASHVIHTVGPIYDAYKNPETVLQNAYRNSLLVAKENKIQYIAFPAISCGVFGYPYGEAAHVAISTVKEFADDFKEVNFVLFSDDIYSVWLEKAKEIVGK